MKTAIKVKDEKFVCRQEVVCSGCGKTYRQQKTNRIKCGACGSWLTQRTVRELRKTKEAK